jgi:hypothetical protein
MINWKYILQAIALLFFLLLICALDDSYESRVNEIKPLPWDQWFNPTSK